MKVILLKDVDKLGKKYDVKDVKPGHARNLLIPQGLVKPATKENLKWLDERKKEAELLVEEDLKKTQGMASNLDGAEMTILVKTGEDGQMFESINAQKIADKIKEMGFNVKKSQIVLESPIKEPGEYPVKINLEHNLEAEITLVVAPENEGKTEEEE